jgi:hypothetical protein
MDNSEVLLVDFGRGGCVFFLFICFFFLYMCDDLLRWTCVTTVVRW